jgi:uncharacterized protein (TIGR02117 family)
MLIRILKGIGVFLLAIIAAIGIYMLAALSLAWIHIPTEHQGNTQITVYVMTNGVHTDIAVPVHSPFLDWNRLMPFSNTKGNDSLAQWLALGWGDKGFYLETPTWADLKFSTALKAVFGLDRTAIHATYYRNLQPGKDCKLLRLSADEYKRLISYIRQSFAGGTAGMPVSIVTRAQYGNSDAFYKANGRYSLFKTCNTWTNNALKACGQRACLWTPFESGVMNLFN